jgi:hypothetical protein
MKVLQVVSIMILYSTINWNIFNKIHIMTNPYQVVIHKGHSHITHYTSYLNISVEHPMVTWSAFKFKYNALILLSLLHVYQMPLEVSLKMFCGSLLKT